MTSLLSALYTMKKDIVITYKLTYMYLLNYIRMYIFHLICTVSVHVYIHIIIGKYWDNCAIKKPSSRSQDDEACHRLWDYSAELVGVDMNQELKTDSE